MDDRAPPPPAGTVRVCLSRAPDGALRLTTETERGSETLEEADERAFDARLRSALSAHGADPGSVRRFLECDAPGPVVIWTAPDARSP